jgi:hypothetical protein
MFKCQECNKVSKSREKSHKKVIQTRKKEYYDEKQRLIGEGTEIVKEMTVCKDCLEKEN